MKSPRVFLISLALLLNVCGKGLALKCYSCTCRADCISRGNINNVKECDSGYNACMTMLDPKGEPNYIAKYCWITHNGEKEGPAPKPGKTAHFCYSDLCNEGYFGTNGHSDSSGSSGNMPEETQAVGARVESKDGNATSAEGGATATSQLAGVTFLMTLLTLTLH